MSGKGCKKTLTNRVGGQVPGRGKVTAIRTIKPKPNKTIHVRVVEKAGKRGGHTVAGGVSTDKKKK